MKPRLNATRAVRELIKAYEPFVSDAERRGRRWVIGWGHRATAREGASISEDNAELLLIYDALQAQQAVDKVVGADLPKAARDALASFAASIGLSAFKVSDVARLAKAGRHREAAAALDSWVRTDVDGRLMVSDRLVQRRRAEKALFLEALVEPVPEAEEPADEPTLGVLVDVDIAFEDQPSLPVVESPEAVQVEPNSEVQPEPDSIVTDEQVVEPVDEVAADAEAMAAIEASSSLSDELPPVPTPHVAEEPSETALKSQQDEAIKAVMSRMAGDMASSIVAAPATEISTETEAPEPVAEPEPEIEPEPAADLTGVKLGFSYLEPATVEVPVEAVATEAVPDVDESQDEAPAESTELEPEPVPSPTPVYATVAVSTVTQPSAPPHPAQAPASAPGMSGESEGPDHPEEDESDHGFEDDILDPAIVAGPEAGEIDANPKPQQSGGWVFPAMLSVGIVMTVLGAWELWSNWSAYVANGLDNSPIGPVVFGSGLLLTVGAGWMTLSRR